MARAGGVAAADTGLGGVAGPLAAGLAVMLALLVTASVSGAHINPAIRLYSTVSCVLYSGV